MDVREVISRYLLEHSITPGITTIDGRDSLLRQGILDSFSLVTLVEFLEQQFGLHVADDEIDAEAFATLDGLCDFVARKQTGRDAGRPAREATKAR